MKEEKSPTSVVKSAQRVLEIFEFFVGRQGAATVMEVARGLNYPQSSTSTLMKSLHHLGYLSYDRHTREYMPTLRIALLGNWVEESIHHEGNLLRLMTGLQQRTGQTVILGLQNDIHVQYIHSIQAASPLRLFVRPGTLRPLVRTALGKTLLSAKTDKEIRALTTRINGLEEQAEHRVKIAFLLEDIARCREDGYCMSDGTVTQGAGVIAMLLPPIAGHPQMALGIGAPLHRLREMKADIIDALQETLQPQQRVREPMRAVK